MDWKIELSRITIDSKEITAPYSVWSHVVLDDVLVTVLKSMNAETKPGAGFELPSDARNVLAFDQAGEIRWFAEAPTTEADYYSSVFEVDSRLLALDSEERLHEFEPVTGRIEASWPRGCFPFRETSVALDGPVQKVIELDGRVFIRCRESDTTLYAFTTDGEELWRSTGRRGMIFEKGGEIIEEVKHGPRRATWYRLDPETGERDSQIEKPF